MHALSVTRARTDPLAPDNALDVVIEVQESPLLVGGVGAQVATNSAGANTNV